MSDKKTDRIWLAVSIIGFFLLAISFFLMPIESRNDFDSLSAVSLIAGLLFWISIIIIVMSQIIISHRIKRWLSSIGMRRVRMKKIGIISFFQNRYGTISDISAIVSLIGFLVFVVLSHGIDRISYIFLILFLLSFSLHSILNGKSFFVIMNKNKIMRAIQKNRANQKIKLEENGK